MLAFRPRRHRSDVAGGPEPRHRLASFAIVTDHRQQEFNGILNHVRSWAAGRSQIAAVALVGSWARNEQRMDSDVDIVVLATDTEVFVRDEGWIADATPDQAVLVKTAEWGVLVERRLLLASGIELEFGFVAPSWASTAPIDPGTLRVVANGCRPIHDPNGRIAALIKAAEDL